MKNRWDDQFEDLKQFIDSRFSQSEARFDEKLDKLERRLERRMDNGFAGVGDSFDLVHDHLGKFDKRLTKLEKVT